MKVGCLDGILFPANCPRRLPNLLASDFPSVAAAEVVGHDQDQALGDGFGLYHNLGCDHLARGQ